MNYLLLFQKKNWTSWNNNQNGKLVWLGSYIGSIFRELAEIKKKVNRYIRGIPTQSVSIGPLDQASTLS
jgi:hypothetical protein